jgi:hypothetical protein
VTTYRLDSLEALGPALAKLLDRAIPVLYASLRDVVAEEAMVKLVDLSPVGNAAVDPHPGKYRASHIPSVDQIVTKVLPNMPAYPVPGIPEVEAVLRNASPTATVFIANAAADERYPDSSYAGPLEGGRRQYSRTGASWSKSAKATPIWIGSEQAPEGIYGPAVQALLGMRATIEASAIRRAQRKL